MPASEADLIERYLRRAGAARPDVILGIGDDAALMRAPAHQELVVTTDALIEGAHFLPGASAHSLGHRALAINLSDLAAMGAEPAWALASLVLPEADEAWLQQFALGFGALARAHDVALVGGNLSRGPLSITVQLTGFVPPGTALRRSGGRPGDWLFVSGTLGDARAGRLLDCWSLVGARSIPSNVWRYSGALNIQVPDSRSDRHYAVWPVPALMYPTACWLTCHVWLRRAAAPLSYALPICRCPHRCRRCAVRGRGSKRCRAVRTTNCSSVFRRCTPR